MVDEKLPLEIAESALDERFDAYLIIANDLETDFKRVGLNDELLNDLLLLKQHNASFEKEITFTVSNKKRVIYSPTGPLNRDYDDVRRIADAVNNGIEKALKSGSKKPLLINAVQNAFNWSNQVAILAALQASYYPLELREATSNKSALKLEKLGYWYTDKSYGEKLLTVLNAVEVGRIVTRDIGGSDPERMAAANVLAYVKKIFESTNNIKISVVEGQDQFEKNYPCFAAVNRAANIVERHKGRLIRLEYDPKDTIDTTLFLVGKGITYDTGGADVKHGGHMAGMHRDKCGAAFVAGFFKSLSLLEPKGLKVIGYMCMARNSIGEEAYVADEIITARSGKRIRVGNTDAEGRMVMVDVLNEAKEAALKEVNPHLFTIATLTGHVIRAYGPDYTAILCNGPGKSNNIDKRFENVGELIGEPFEISTLRREDYRVVTGKSEYEDILQSTNNPSTAESRGHQFPAAFLVLGSGLDKHGNDSESKLPYSHIDIAGSSGPFPGKPTGTPLAAFVFNYVVPRLKLI